MSSQAQEWSPGLQSPMSPPPTYDVLLRSPTLQRQWNIQPREDEGREELPGYSSAISLENVFKKKRELEGAINRASDRGWYRVIVKLQGTALTFYKCKRKGILSMFDGTMHHPDSTEGMKKGKFLRSYNLTHADVGIAADYAKKRYVLRLRAEADQFLLSCESIETFVLWLQSLFAAIDLAPPLDERSIPRDLSMPRRRRVARITSGFSPAPTAEPSSVLREQERILQQYPHLGDIRAASPLPATYLRPRSNNPNHLLPTSIISRARSSFYQHNDPNVTAEGKWRPQHQWSHFYDMLYAKRCMAVLTHRSPRKSNLVIVKGKQFIIDWATGKLSTLPGIDRVEMSGANGAGTSGVRPPSYAEFEGGIRVVRGNMTTSRESMGMVRESVNMGDGFLARSGGVAV